MHRQLKHMLNDVKQQQAETSEDLLGHVDRAVDAAMGKLAEMIKPLADQRVRATQAQQQALEAAMKHRVMVQVQQAQSQARLQEKTARQLQMLQIQQQQQQLQDMVRASQEREKRRGYGGKVRRDENEGEDERRVGAEPMSRKQQQHQQQQQKQQQQKQQLRQKQEQDQQRAPDDKPAREPRVNFAPSPRSSSGPLAQTQSQTQTRAHQQSSDTYRVLTPRASGSGQAPPSRAVAVAASMHNAGPSKTNSFHSQTQSHNHNHGQGQGQGRTAQHQGQSQPQPQPQLQSRGEDLLQMAGGDRQGVRWATQPPPVADLVISSSIDNLAAPSVRDLQTIPGGSVPGAPSFASHEPVFHTASGVGHAQGQGQGQRQGVPLAQLPHLSRQLGVVAAQPVLVIAGNQRQPPSLWEQEREHKVRPKRGAALVTMDPFGQPIQDDNEEDDDDKEDCGAGGDEAEDVGKARPDYPVPTPESGFVDTEDGALEGPGAPFRGLDSFLSRVAPADAPPTAADRAAAHTGAHNSSYAQERHLGRTVERLLGTVVESQKSLISEVVEGQVRIAEELKESSRATAKASAAFAAAAAASAGSSGSGWAHPHTHAAGGKTAWNPADAGSVSGSSAGIGGGMSEEHILALVTQCMEKLAPRPESTASASQPLGGRDSASGEADHHQASQAAEKAAAAQAAAAAATATANAAAAAATASKEHAEAQMLLLEERLRSHLESEVRRGVGEGVDEGVRRALATFEAERESRERAAVAAATATATAAAAAADAAAATAASTAASGSVAAAAAESQLAFRHVPLPFMAASAHHYSSEVLETLRADAAESGAALRALRVGLGSGGARGGHGDAAGAGRGRDSHFARAENSDEAWLDGEDEEEQGEEGGGGRKAWLAAGVPAGLPQGALISSRASLKLEPEELSELYDEDDDANAGGVAGAGTGGEASWSMSEDDGEAFLRRHVDDRLLLTDRARANLMQGGRL